MIYIIASANDVVLVSTESTPNMIWARQVLNQNTFGEDLNQHSAIERSKTVPMTTTSSIIPPAQWRWDRFDAKKVTSVAWASRNCVGMDSHLPEAHQAMQRRVLQDEKAAGQIIASELHLFLHDAANITQMTYRCKLTQ